MPPKVKRTNTVVISPQEIAMALRQYLAKQGVPQSASANVDFKVERHPGDYYDSIPDSWHFKEAVVSWTEEIG